MVGGGTKNVQPGAPHRYHPVAVGLETEEVELGVDGQDHRRPDRTKTTTR